MAEETIAIASGEKRDLDLGGLCFRICKRAIGDDGGPSVEVLSDASAEEPILRFDLFRGDPHCHVPASDQKPRPLAKLRGADPTESWLGDLAELLPPLIREAGDEALADRTDVQTLSDQIERLRSAIRDAPEPGEPTLHPLTPEMRKVLGG